MYHRLSLSPCFPTPHHLDHPPPKFPPNNTIRPTIHDICAPPPPSPLPHILSQEAPPRKSTQSVMSKGPPLIPFFPKIFWPAQMWPLSKLPILATPPKLVCLQRLWNGGGPRQGVECGPWRRRAAHSAHRNPLTTYKMESRFSRLLPKKNIKKKPSFWQRWRVGPCRGEYFVANSTRTGGAHVRPDWIDVYAAKSPSPCKESLKLIKDPPTAAGLPPYQPLAWPFAP